MIEKWPDDVLAELILRDATRLQSTYRTGWQSDIGNHIHTLVARVRELEAELAKRQRAVEEFLCATGNDLCHQNRLDLVHAFGLPCDMPVGCLPSEAEFRQKCDQYAQELYGPAGPSDDELPVTLDWLVGLVGEQRAGMVPADFSDVFYICTGPQEIKCPPTRGKVRLLCEALEIPTTEGK